MSIELQDYIAQARKVGKSDEEIEKSLLNKGWSKSDVQNEFHPQPPKPKNLLKGIVTSVILVVLAIVGFLVFFVFALGDSLPGGSVKTSTWMLLILPAIPWLILLKNSITEIIKGGKRAIIGLLFTIISLLLLLILITFINS